MNRARRTTPLRRIAPVLVALAGGSAGAAVVTGCAVEAGPAYPTADYGDYPPDAYIATTEPVYFEGHATYWYGGRWYYRDAGGWWARYDREPPALYQRRTQGPPRRRTYEAPRAHPPSHAAGYVAPRGRR